MKSSKMISGLESHLGYWLRRVSNQVSHAFALKVQSRGVTVAEWVVLRSMAEVERVHPGELAKQLGMTRGAVSKLLDRLIGKSLVSVSVEKKDRRFQWVKLTASGKAIVPVLACLADENEAAFFGCLGARERAHLFGLMRKIVACNGIEALPVD